MKKKKIFLLFIISLLCFQLRAIEVGKWNFVAEQEYCYIGSLPTKEEGDYTKRGDTYILVYRINNNPEMIVQVTAGYNYDENKPVIVIIDNISFDFFGKDDSAWSRNKDKKVISAMKKGETMIIKGYSSKGTLTADTYTLLGFTASYNRLSKDC